MNIKDLVKNNKVFFSHYSGGELFYNIFHEGKRFVFPVPISDTGNGTFQASEKAIFFMRWIRKAVENKELYVASKA